MTQEKKNRHGVALASGFLVLGLWLAGTAGAAEDRCAQVQDAGDIQVGDKLLRVAPDIQAPELRRVDALFSARCLDLAQEVLDAYVAKHPDDHHVRFIYARMTWMFGQMDRAKAIITGSLAEYPQFTSLKVLLASMYIDEDRFSEAQSLLNEIQQAEPNDLWLYMDRLRLETMLTPTPQTTTKLLQVLENTQLPGSARETAAMYIQRTRWHTPEQVERAYRAQLTFESATPYWMKALNFALYLIEERKKYDEARKLLDGLLAKSEYEAGWQQAKTLKADSYLREAEALDGKSADKIRPLVNQAAAAVDNDYSQLEYLLSQRPGALSRLQPYLPEGGAVAERKDEYGRTALCNALLELKAEVIRAALGRGADANGDCEGWLPVDLLLNMPWDDPPQDIAQRQDILRALLDAGGTAETVADCRRDCERYLLPVMREYRR